MAEIESKPFREAAASWLETRTPFISPRTFFDYTKYIKTLSLFFGEQRLNEITAEHLRAYQKVRLTCASARKVNQECGIIQQIRKRLGTWGDIAGDYQPLPVSYESPGRALDERQQSRLLQAAASKPHWEMAYLFAVVSVNTTAGPQEVWTLRHQNVDLVEGTFRIQPEGAKNMHRARLIPLNPVAFAAMDRIIELAKRRGSFEPHHYIFPFRVRGNAYSGIYDPNKHCTTCKSAWKALTHAADLPGLRPYDLRHTAITTILQNADVSEETVKAIAGHVSQRILKTYSHIRIDAKRAALDALVRKPVQTADRPAKKKASRGVKITKTGGHEIAK
jgi:integrase